MNFQRSEINDEAYSPDREADAAVETFGRLLRCRPWTTPESTMNQEFRVAVYSPPEADLPFIVSVLDDEGLLLTIAASCAEEAEMLASWHRRGATVSKHDRLVDEALRAH